MPLIEGKCPECGAALKLSDRAKGELTCPYCGSLYLVEKAITNYNTTVNNTTINNINTDKVIVQGKNIDSLAKRGMELINPCRIKSDIGKGKEKNDQVINELRNIANSIIETDANNFYARLFLIDSYDSNFKNFEICLLTEDEVEQKIFVDYLTKKLNWNLYFIKEINEDLIHAQLKEANSGDTINSVIAFSEMSKKCQYAKEKYDEFINELQKNICNLFTKSSYNFTNFYYSKESVQNTYEFESLCELASNLHLFLNLFEKYIEDKEAIYKAGEKIMNVVKANITVIMQYNSIYGKGLVSDSFALAGEKPDEQQLNEITKVVVKNIWTSRRSTVITLYNDKVVVSIENLPERTINVKDILVFNSLINVSSSFITTLWYDLVYKTGDSSYTLIHFGYDLKTNETISSCQVYSALSKWAIVNDIRRSDTKYSNVNPFTQGYNGLKYEDTQPELAPRKFCYVATCVYGSYDCPQVWQLRRYRDFYLDNHWWGRLFIKVYYKVSPVMIKWFGKTKAFKKFFKKILDKKVAKLTKLNYSDSQYEDKY